VARGNEFFYGYTYDYESYEKKNVPKITVLGCINDPDADYSFDYFWVFKHDESGRVFWGTDRGCSCPSPFEDDHFTTPDDTSFSEVTKSNLEEFVKELWAHYDGADSLQDEKREAEKLVREALA